MSHQFWYGLVTGMLAYFVLEVLFTATILRFFPSQIGRIQCMTDRLFRRVAHPRAYLNARSADSLYGVGVEHDLEPEDEEDEAH